MAHKLSTAVLLGALGFAPTVSALGLGNAETGSALNEPLSARIPLLSVGAEELSSVNVSLASPQAFERAGMDRPFYLSQLKFEVKAGKDGQAFIQVTTQRPVKEPFLDFLVKVRWPQGQLVREYTMLLDPPVYASEQVTAPAPTAVRSATTTAGPPSKPAVSGIDLAAAGEAPQTGDASGAGETTYGPVGANETLYAIADRLRPDSVSVNQTMVALVRANPQAFDGNNMNALHQGAVLRVPARREIAATTEAEAVAEVQRQWAQWKADRQVAASDEAPAEQSADATASAPQQTAAVEEQQSGGKLDIVAPEESEGQAATTSLADRDLAPSANNIERLQRRLTMMDETTASLESENADLRQQIESLKRALEQLESAVNIQTQSSLANVADPQSSAGTAAATESTEAENAAPSVDAVLGSEFWASEIVSIPTLAPQSEPAATAAAPIAAPEKQAANEPRTEANNEPQAAPEAASLQAQVVDVVQRLLDDPNALLYAGGAVALLLALLLVVRRRGDNDEAAPAMPEPAVPEFKRAVATATADDAGDEPRRPAAAADPEASPLEQVELCVAYGRYEQAQDLLDRALGENPLDKALRLKLLEVLVKQSDRPGFEAEAQVLYTQIEADSDPVWQQTVALGRQIAAEHPLFADDQDDDGEDFALTETESDAGGDDAQYATGDEDLSFLLEESESQHNAAEESEFDLDFALDDDQTVNRRAADETPAPGAAADDVDFDLDDSLDVTSADDRNVDFDIDDSGSSFDALAEELPGAGTSQDDDLDFDLPEDLAPTEVQTEPSAEADDGLDFGDFRFDASSQEQTDDGDDEVDFDEVSTKLDLARAYLDMGDAEGARSLLDEVSEEGDDAQRQEAGELLQRAAS